MTTTRVARVAKIFLVRSKVTATTIINMIPISPKSFCDDSKKAVFRGTFPDTYTSN
ncbi:MAG: Uncharacterised protein [Flavobacteriaceae bacterium]|nr:MAG: Uncharacterised protein [Flavobacteriaceae bacterium]